MDAQKYSGVPQSAFDVRTFRPLDDQVLIRLEEIDKQTASKMLWIPDNAKRGDYEIYQGTVISTGPGALRKCDGQRNPVDVKPGDRVVYYWAYGEMQVTAIRDAEGHECRLIPESSIQAVIE